MSDLDSFKALRATVDFLLVQCDITLTRKQEINIVKLYSLLSKEGILPEYFHLMLTRHCLNFKRWCKYLDNDYPHQNLILDAFSWHHTAYHIQWSLIYERLRR